MHSEKTCSQAPERGGCMMRVNGATEIERMGSKEVEEDDDEEEDEEEIVE